MAGPHQMTVHVWHVNSSQEKKNSHPYRAHAHTRIVWPASILPLSPAFVD